MAERDHTDAKERLKACGISICHGGRSFPEGAMNGKGHLSIQTSIELTKASTGVVPHAR